MCPGRSSKLSMVALLFTWDQPTRNIAAVNRKSAYSVSKRLSCVTFLGIYVNMADVSPRSKTPPKLSANPLFLRDEELRQALEMLFFAYRALTAEPDAILEGYRFGRAEHRVVGKGGEEGKSGSRGVNLGVSRVIKNKNKIY